MVAVEWEHKAAHVFVTVNLYNKNCTFIYFKSIFSWQNISSFALIVYFYYTYEEMHQFLPNNRNIQGSTNDSLTLSTVYIYYCTAILYILRHHAHSENIFLWDLVENCSNCWLLVFFGASLVSKIVFAQSEFQFAAFIHQGKAKYIRIG